MAKTHGSELVAQSTTKEPKLKKVSRTAFAALISAGLVGTFALPAYANKPAESTPVAANQAPQLLATVESEDLSVASVPALAVVENPEILESERIEAEEAAAEEARLAEEQQQEETVQAVAPRSDIPAGSGGAGLLAAALAQLGTFQDCTALLENGLRAIGHGAGDLGTGVWEYEGVYGTRVPLDQLAPGDILIYGNAGSGAHVAVYSGGGNAVHSGVWGGRGTEILPINSALGLPLTGAVRPY